ncbi:MAG: SIR2 family NAD-dependent protein deacylase [Planctomycetota bacterium]|jgi:NAD-dependent deacetylase
MEERLKEILQEAMESNAHLVVLTGAGISAESGIPTFRGPEGYWTVGSKEYRPEEMATWHMFQRCPDEVWQWYLYRRGICNRAEPNAGHLAVKEMEELFGDRFTLLTQNVDGLHVRAGSTMERTFEIHGNINRMRCARECRQSTYPMPDGVPDKTKEESLNDEDRALLQCPDCGGLARPHVLWFDECYDENYFRYHSSLQAASQADLLISVGTSGATNLPMQVGQVVLGKGATLIDVNPGENPFSYMAQQSGGFFCQGESGKILPGFVQIMKEKA